jgi:hypothetical protein
LSAITGVEAETLKGLSVVEISEKLRWIIDPEILLFRRVCGRVVKRDPVTGVYYPVPFATVHVEDTDCNLIGYWPGGWPWGWYFPFHCRREDIATTRTDACGNFCVWIPRFDIDWILRWRRFRICWPDIFIRPKLRDLLPLEEVPHRPFPEPDPPPYELLTKLSPNAFDAFAGSGGHLGDRLTRVRESLVFGAPAPDLNEILDEPAFERELPPPLPSEFRKALAGHAEVGGDKTKTRGGDAVRGAIALHAGIAVKELADLDVSRYIGPFFRCRDIYLPEWQAIFDVPDITFRVTQDVDGDGTEETIYQESYFQVRWNAGTIPPPTLVASSIAVETRSCRVPEVVCGNVPAIQFAGLHPLNNAVYLDPAIGYAKRPNRPIPPSGPRPDAETPFTGTLQLYGCTNIANARYYRVSHSEDNGATFSVFTGVNWPLHRLDGGPLESTHVDPTGWYDVITATGVYHEERLLFEWSTPPIGKYVLKVEVADSTHTVIGTSATVALQIDNTAPTVAFTKLAWKFQSEAATAFDRADRNLLIPCPVIRRGVPSQVVQVRAEVMVSANHLRDASLGTSGCGGGAFTELSTPTPHSSHWHDAVTDNTELLTATYELAATALEGCYSFACTANSRAFNPAGSDNGHLLDWLYDPVYVYTHRGISVSVVNG